MGDRTKSRTRSKKPRKPLDSAALRDLALSYVARYATTGAKLERYLARKLRERGWEDEAEPDIGGLTARYTELGYIDDEAYARTRSDGLLRRGYGARRVAQALGEAGVEADIREKMRPGEAAAREAALALARRRRFGPFAAEPPDRERREKQFAAMIRAGHGFDAARAVLDAANQAEAEEWAAEAYDEED